MASDVTDSVARDALKDTLKELVNLRGMFDSLVRSGAIEHCRCGDPDCPTYMMKDRACQELSHARDRVLSAFRRTCRGFKLSQD